MLLKHSFTKLILSTKHSLKAFLLPEVYILQPFTVDTSLSIRL
ncbi:MAG: hypothetical protein ACI90A_001761 [Shewanella sp.]